MKASTFRNLQEILLSKRTRKLAAAFLIALLALLLGIDQAKLEPLHSWLYQSQPGLYRVVHVNDGDTITVDMSGTEETIRLIGINTPETHHPSKPVQCFGKQASEFTRQLIGTNDVRLESDPLNDNRDRYGRLLRYVYLEDDTFVNLEIVSSGYGFAYTSFPMENPEQFLAAERLAHSESRGLWSECSIIESESGAETTPEA